MSDLETKVHVIVYVTFTSDLDTEGHVMVYVTFVNSACIRPNAMNFFISSFFLIQESHSNYCYSQKLLQLYCEGPLFNFVWGAAQQNISIYNFSVKVSNKLMTLKSKVTSWSTYFFNFCLYSYFSQINDVTLARHGVITRIHRKSRLA